MKSILFEVTPEDIESSVLDDGEYPYLWKLYIPILSAFSVEYFTIQYGELVTFSTKNDVVNGNFITVESGIDSNDWNKNLTVVITYNGIRDFSLLFPWIDIEDLRIRLGEFYEEADKSFETGAWLSFALMCGAVFEGMLFAKLSSSTQETNYFNLLEMGRQSHLIKEDQYTNMNKVRELRNLVHANKYNRAYIMRKDAMDIRKTLSELLKEFSK